jgi:antitoxin component of RelBE/YafQ-DinJ toxin-antitoxin module
VTQEDNGVPKTNHIMQIRVEHTLWKKFKRYCAHNDATPSEIVREFMRAMIREERGLSKTLDQAQASLDSAIYTDVKA